MTTKQAKQKIKEAGGSWKVFTKWMSGQTVGLNKDGTTNIYDKDVERFIRYECDPKKVKYSIGLFNEWKNRKVDYWYEYNFLIECNKINRGRIMKKSRYYGLTEEIPLDVNKKTMQVKIDWGVLNWMISKLQ
jgi:hypothetical protein